MDSWLLRHRVQDETDSEPEQSGIVEDAVPSTSVSASGSALSSPGPSSLGVGLRRSARVAAARPVRPVRPVPALFSPASSQSSVHVSLGESGDDSGQEEWDHTREEYHDSDSVSGMFFWLNESPFVGLFWIPVFCLFFFA